MTATPPFPVTRGILKILAFIALLLSACVIGPWLLVCSSLATIADGPVIDHWPDHIAEWIERNIVRLWPWSPYTLDTVLTWALILGGVAHIGLIVWLFL